MYKALFYCSVAILGLLAAPLLVSAQDQPSGVIGSFADDAREARITKLKETYRISLSEKETELVSSRCTEAQKSLQKISDRLNKTRSERDATYSSVVAALKQLKLRFDDAQIDASNLELLIVSYQQKHTNFQVNASDYDISLQDSVTIDCKSDPVGFRATLEGVRTARKDLVRISSDIVESTNSSLPTTFDSLKLRLLTNGEARGE